MYRDIGLNIRLFRIRFRIHIDDIVEETKLTRDTLYKIERGKLYGKSFVTYIMYLKNHNADLNKIFDLDSYN